MSLFAAILYEQLKRATPSDANLPSQGCSGCSRWQWACGTLEPGLTAGFPLQMPCAPSEAGQRSFPQRVSALLGPGFKFPSPLPSPCSCVALRQPCNLSEPALPCSENSNPCLTSSRACGGIAEVRYATGFSLFLP